METLKILNGNTKMIAHRGLSGLETENTMAAFIAAGNKSYYGIECDVRITKDDVFVVCHDDSTKRISKVHKKIRETTYDELKQINLYDLDTLETREYLKIPTLKEYLLVCKKYQKVCVIELKIEFTEAEILRLLSEIDAIKYMNYVIFISFKEHNLKLIRRHQPKVAIQYLVEEFNQETIDFLRKMNMDVNIRFTELIKEHVEEFHKYGIKVNVWTVDNPIVALMLISWDVDYITTNILE